MEKTGKLIVVGENIHCTRIHKVGGKYVKPLEDGPYVISYTDQGENKHMPVPTSFMEREDWKNGKLKHTAAAIWQGLNGTGDEKKAGIEYLHYLARKQEQNDSSFLDVNVDEYSTEVDEKIDVISWIVDILQETARIPLSIDSSNINILEKGLSKCDRTKGKPMVNSVSLEREEAIEIAQQYDAAVIAGATGKDRMPESVEERVDNLKKLIELLLSKGFQNNDIYLDPLVFPVSVNSQNGLMVLDAITALREAFGPDIHFAPGLSNISFGLPKRKLINQTFTFLCMERGLDGAIVDPIQINQEKIGNLDTQSEAFQYAKSLLLGEDQFGMNYITASREGKL